jgi:two-component system, chemotaxis family, protein-glutamate methylesterase/glutaminase
VYIVPQGFQPSLKEAGSGFSLNLQQGAPVSGFNPSSNVLFKSALQLRQSSRIAALLLSGFGEDGVEGLVNLREAGAYTIVLAPDTAPFGSLPEAAIRHGAAEAVVSPGELSDVLYRYRSKLVS